MDFRKVILCWSLFRILTPMFFIKKLYFSLVCTYLRIINRNYIRNIYCLFNNSKPINILQVFANSCLQSLTYLLTSKHHHILGWTILISNLPNNCEDSTFLIHIQDSDRWVEWSMSVSEHPLCFFTISAKQTD